MERENRAEENVLKAKLNIIKQFIITKLNVKLVLEIPDVTALFKYQKK